MHIILYLRAIKSEQNSTCKMVVWFLSNKTLHRFPACFNNTLGTINNVALAITEMKIWTMLASNVSGEDMKMVSLEVTLNILLDNKSIMINQ